MCISLVFSNSKNIYTAKKNHAQSWHGLWQSCTLNQTICNLLWRVEVRDERIFRASVILCSRLHDWGLAAASIQDAGCSVSALRVVNHRLPACSAHPRHGNVFTGRTTGLTEQTAWFRILPPKQDTSWLCCCPWRPNFTSNVTLNISGTCNCFVPSANIPHIAMLPDNPRQKVL